jgi:hypothetical protein
MDHGILNQTEVELSDGVMMLVSTVYHEELKQRALVGVQRILDEHYFFSRVRVKKKSHLRIERATS